MLYKPKFCCNCGEKIETTQWSIFDSRRFCAVCAEENRKYDYLPRAVVIVGILSAVFGLGSYLEGYRLSSQANLFTYSQDALPKNQKRSLSDDIEAKSNTSFSQSRQTDKGANIQANTSINNNLNHPNYSNRPAKEEVYFCGAMTKKGTPCTRRVKAKGMRCWQHKDL